MAAIKETNFNFPGQTGFYRGKVRDVYYFGNKMAIVVTDRISAFDVILPKAIPFKGQILNHIAVRNLEASNDIVPNWLEGSPDPNVSIGKRCKPIPIEMVIRGYLSGHAWREYKSGKSHICGVEFPKEMKENDPFPEPIITPATKATEGHDEDISREDIIARGIVSEEVYCKLEEYTRKLFARGSELASKQGLILVDTKYEFGIYNEEIHLIDEIHTPDSSRYFYSEGYSERQNRGEKQKQLSKEFVREWLMENGFQGKEGQKIPEMTDSVLKMITGRYMELYEKLTGENFPEQDDKDPLNRIEQNIRVSFA
jgi:phosphoribosylaminoimidazole-succinocarboxamide synthase